MDASSAQGPTPSPLMPEVITTADGYDNFDIGIDSAEPHIATNPANPLWFFNAFNINRSHNTVDGHDWTFATPNFGPGFSMRGDPVVAYDSLGNLYYENMYSATAGGSILGCKVMVSSNNGATWSPSLTAISGVDKNWIACDQTAGPFANYAYTVMTASGGGNFARSTDFGASWTNTWTFGTQSLPGMMVAVGPDVLAGNNIPGGCVYVVTNSGPSSGSVYTFYRSTDGGESFDLRSSLTVAGYVGTLNSIGRLVINNARTRPYPFIAADNSHGPHRGRLYLVYASNVPAGNGNTPDIFLQYSTDQGSTWSAGVRVNDNADPTTTNEWFPAIWCDKETGRLYIKWYDMRNDPTNQRAWVYGTYTDDGGQTFVPNVKISNQDFVYPAPACGVNTNCYRGDYDGITSNAITSMSVWTDFRNGNYGSVVGYFPDFAMQVSPSTVALGSNDSVNITVRVPGVKLYTHPVKFSATVSPSGSVALDWPGGDSLSSYPDSLTLKIRSNNAANRTYTVTVTGQGPNGTPVHRRTIAVQTPTLALGSPNGGEVWHAGATRNIQWTSAAYAGDVRIELSRNGGATFAETLFTGTPNDGSQGWLVTGPAGAAMRMKISGVTNPLTGDTSAANFSIVQAAISVLGPNGGEVLGFGSPRNISWNSTNMSGPVRVLLSRNGGASYPETLFANTSNDGVQAWTVTPPLTAAGRIRIESIDIPGVSDAGDSNFSIVQHVPVGPGWNLISVPVVPPNPSAAFLFPTASSAAFRFTGDGYVPGDSLNSGEGYWIKFDSSTSVPLIGALRESDTVDVGAGWSLLGSLSYGVDVDSIGQLPPGILTNVYRYVPGTGYQHDPQTIEPGEGVWIKTSQSGTLILKREEPLFLRRREPRSKQ